MSHIEVEFDRFKTVPRSRKWSKPVVTGSVEEVKIFGSPGNDLDVSFGIKSNGAECEFVVHLTEQEARLILKSILHVLDKQI
jgi:hypothetical protein